MTTIAALDLAAFLWFALCWVGYALAVDHSPLRRRSVIAAMDRYRERWMESMIRRDNRMVDVQVVRTLVRSTVFFASTTIFVIAGLVAVLGAVDEVLRLMRDVPFVEAPGRTLSELRVLALILVFTYVFFKFSWAIRLYNNCAVILGSLPQPPECADAERADGRRIAAVVGRAARHFNGGLRGYYFGLGYLAWFVHPWAFMAASAWVVLVLIRREFRSATLRVLTERG
ncbi:MAG: DUF599 domain-containing protein [Proteobacteria bacterium]|nr:DUF599 domain-containing protein [Pseudomonadota bacterium]